MMQNASPVPPVGFITRILIPLLHLALLPLLLLLPSCTGEQTSPTPRSDLDSDLERGSLADRIDHAVEIHRSGMVDSARVLLASAKSDAEAAGNEAEATRALTWMGNAARALGQYDVARSEGEEALRRKLAAGLTQQLFRSYSSLGLIAWQEGRLREALELHRNSQLAALEVGDSLGAATAAGNMGLVWWEQGELELAREGMERMWRGGEAAGDVLVQANASTNLGGLDRALGDLQTAVSTLTEALVLQRSINQADGIQNTLAQLGSAYAALGEMGRAHAYYDSALSVSREFGLLGEEAYNKEVLAELYHLIGDERRALQFYEELIVTNRELGRDLELGVDLRARSELLASLGELGGARLGVLEALELHEQIGASVEAISDRLVLAGVLSLLGEYEAARAELDRAAERAREVGIPHLNLEVALARARVAELSGDHGSVLSGLEGSLEFIPQGDYGMSWQVYAARASAYRELGFPDSAVVAGREAVASVERVRRGFGSGVLQATYVDARLETYGELVEAYLELGQVSRAFEVADATKARSLGSGLQVLASAHRDPAGPSGAQASGDWAEAERLLRRIDDIIQRSRLPWNQIPEIQEDLKRGLASARSSYEDLLIRVSESGGVGVALLGGSGVDISEVQRSLAPNEALVQYFLTPARLVVFVLRGDSIAVASSEIDREALMAQVRVARGLVDEPGRAAGSIVFERLYEVVMGPAMGTGLIEGATRLTIVPHGVLTYLPFAALRNSESLVYLVQDYELAFLPSAAPLPLLRATGIDRERTKSRDIVAFAPFPRELPASEDEVRVATKGRRGRAVVGARATERNVREALTTAGTVHLATHGILNAQNPLFSRIELAPGREGSSDDGRLEVHELLGLDINAQLIVLSGCDTGSGAGWNTAFDQGEDYTTLAQAFLIAGASNVLATLWPIADGSAAEFADRFYRTLPGTNPVTALAVAQREMIASGTLSDPFHWAPYRITGSGR